MAISMLKIRRPLGRLIFNMGIAIPGKTVFLIETAPWWFSHSDENAMLIYFIYILNLANRFVIHLFERVVLREGQ